MATQDLLLPLPKEDHLPRWTRLVVVCYVPSAFCFFNYGLGLLGLPLICKHWHIPVATVAYLKSVAELAETAFSMPSSGVAIRYGAKNCVMLGCIAYTCACLGLIEASNFAFLAFGYFLQSGAVKVFNRGRGLIMKEVPKDLYGRTNGHLIFIRCVFMSIAPCVLSLILSVIGNPQLIFGVQAVLGACMMLSIAADREGARTQCDRTSQNRTSGACTPDPPKEEVTYADLISGECLNVLVRSVGLCSCISMLIGAYNILLPVASLSLNIPIADISLSMTVCYGIGGAFSTFGGSSVDRFGRRPAMVAAMLCFALGHAILGSLLFFQKSQRWLVLLAAAICLGLGESAAGPLRGVLKNDNADCVKAWAYRHGRDEKAAIAKSFGVLDVLLDIVGLAYPVAIGLCSTYLSATIASVACASIGVLAAAWAICLPSNFQ